MLYVENPLRRGFYPDPSVCRAEGRYYCVHSSFACAPGIPIFVSDDLASWKQIGHVLERENQLHLEHSAARGGIYAPSIRYDGKLFYVIATNVDYGGNFYVTAENPEGPWSDPCYLPEAEGIDPCLFFDHGTCYYLGQRLVKDADYEGACEIWLQELNLREHRLTGEISVLWRGAMNQAWWPEGPHLYFRNGYYYLMIAEGGTEFHHSVTIARSRGLRGPYHGNPSNPILTHRHLGRSFPVQNVGHGDLIETTKGKWYMLMLGTRPLEGCAEAGRETFLADVSWEEDWPVVNPGYGRLRHWQPVDDGEDRVSYLAIPEHETLMIDWQKPLDLRLTGFREFLPEHKPELCRLNGSTLLLTMRKDILSFLGVRMLSREFDIRVSCRIAGSVQAGLQCFYDEKNAVCLEMSYVRQSVGDGRCCLIEIKNGVRRIRDSIVISGKETTELSLCCRNRTITAAVNGRELAGTLTTEFLCSERTGGFTGVLQGIYGKGNGEAEFGPLYVDYYLV